MMRAVKISIVFFILFFIAAWPFHAERFAIEETNKYRVIANGWVSIYADIHMSDKLTWAEKIKRTISADFVHGRFRPAFFFYVTSSYALSPIVHGRSPAAEGRPYRELMNGDLRLFSFILLATLSLASVLMSVIIYRYTKEIVFSIIPAIFIPLSQTLTFNFLSGVIDSQEIPLIFCLSLWIYLLFASLSAKGKVWAIGFFLTSLISLFIAFLIKETIVAICIPLFFITIFVVILNEKKSFESEQTKRNKRFIYASFIFSCICSLALIIIIFNNKKGYADGYNINNYDQLNISIKVLSVWMSSYSLHNIIGYAPILIALYISVKKKSKSLHGIPLFYHFIFIVMLLIAIYSFLLILIPWNPLGIKYVFPSVFLFSFSVAFSLSLLTALAKEKYGFFGYLSYLILVPYIILYNSYIDKSEKEKIYLSEIGTYGVSISKNLAESISRISSSNKKISIFIDYGDRIVYGNPITFGILHVMRLLNLDMNVNITKKDGEKIKNFSMPVYELSSFIEHKAGRNIYITDKKEELENSIFDAVYYGYNEKDKPLKILLFNKIEKCYCLTGDFFFYKSRSGLFPNFSIYKYLPCSVKE